MLDVVERMLREEYETVWNENEMIWNKRGVCVKQLFKTTDAAERKCFEAALKRIEDICEKTQAQCLVLFKLLYQPVVYDSDCSDDSDDYRLGDVC